MSGPRPACVAVIGAGIAGAASAWALARRGIGVELVERFEPGHDRGGSHGASRIFRLAYADGDHVRLAQEALEGWRRLERESDERLLELTGLLALSADVAGLAAALDAGGVAWDELGPAAVEERLGIRVPAGARALLQHEAGIVRADAALRAFTAGARARGAHLRTGVRVEALEPGDGGVLVHANGAGRHYDAVVVAAGSWARALLDPLGIALALTPTRETVVYFRRAGRPASLIDDYEPPAGAAGYALHDPAHGLKAGLHQAGAPADPDAPAEPDPALLAATVAWARDRFPGLGEPAAAQTCLYANLPGDRFAIEREGRVVVASACSGHGFKFAPAVGERVADLVLQAVA